MKSKLLWKFILAYIAFGILSFIIISIAGSRFVENSIINVKSKELYNEAKSISDNILTGTYTLEEIHIDLKAIAAAQDTSIWLLSNDGQIILNTAVEINREEPEVIENFDRVKLGTGYYFTGSFFDYFAEDILSIVMPVTSDAGISGYVVIHLPMRYIVEYKEKVLIAVHLTIIILFILSLVILLLILIWVILPIRKISRGAKEFADGNLKYKIDLKTSDEMGYLSNTLDYMSSELEKSGDAQREFLAAVSHDFRSPLTSIRGYAEAISDGTIPVEMQDKYLKIIVSEADRLNKLSQEMLTMEKISSKSRELSRTDFDVNELITETAASFEGACRSKNIMINMLLEEETLYVNADFSKIQQVFYNLIDNAIKFSKNNSTIELETSIIHNRAYCVVRDHGIGIASKDLSKIFDRFYKSDTSRGKDPRGSGLGLSIVKDIINAHESKINVVSTVDTGTEFSFSLPLIEK